MTDPPATISELERSVGCMRVCASVGADRSPHCASWAARGECDANPEFMGEWCKPSCGRCLPGEMVEIKGQHELQPTSARG